MNGVTPGWKTSEFWLHLIAYAPAIAAIFLPQSSVILLGITAVSHLAASAYSANRSGVKIAALAPTAIDIAGAVADALDKARAAVPVAATPNAATAAPATAAPATAAPAPAK